VRPDEKEAGRPTDAALRGPSFVVGCRWGALCSMGSVGVLAGTRALFPPAAGCGRLVCQEAVAGVLRAFTSAARRAMLGPVRLPRGHYSDDNWTRFARGCRFCATAYTAVCLLSSGSRVRIPPGTPNPPQSFPVCPPANTRHTGSRVWPHDLLQSLCPISRCVILALGPRDYWPFSLRL